MFLAHPETACKAYEKECITLHRVGKRYFLKGTWSADDRNGMELYSTP